MNTDDFHTRYAEELAGIGPGSCSATGYAAELARRLQDVLERAGVSQVDLAAKVGVSPMHLNHWIHGRRAPSAENLAALLNALWWVDARELLCGKRHTAGGSADPGLTADSRTKSL